MNTERTQDFGASPPRGFRIERGAQAIGKDGPLGTVEQVVVDRESGQLQALVVRDQGGREVELPANRIERASGDQVFLSLGHADVAAHPELARPYDPSLYVPVEQGAVLPPRTMLHAPQDGPLVTDMEEDAVEITAAVLEAQSARPPLTRIVPVLAQPPEAPWSNGPRAPREMASRVPTIGALLAGLAAAAILVGAAAVGATYMRRQRRRAAPGIPRASIQVGAVPTATTAWPEGARSRTTARSSQRTVAPVADQPLPAGSSQRAAAATKPDAGTIAARRESQVVGNQLADTASAAQSQVSRGKSRMQHVDARRRRARTMERAQSKASRSVQRAPGRTQWFGLGLVVGSAWALLFTPVPGQVTREALASAWRGLRERMGPSLPAGQGVPTFEEAGARPRNPTMEDRTTFAGHDVSSPILEPMWDEPVLSPEGLDDSAEVLPGTAAGS